MTIHRNAYVKVKTKTHAFTGRVVAVEDQLVTVEIVERGTLTKLRRGDLTTVGIHTVRAFPGAAKPTHKRVCWPSEKPVPPVNNSPRPPSPSGPGKACTKSRSVWAIPNNVGRGRRSR